MDINKLMQAMKDKKSALKQKAKTLKPAPGDSRYVLLPGWAKGSEHIWWHDFGQHYIKNAAGEIQAVYPCLDKTYGHQCPVCDGLAKAMHSVDDETKALLKEAASGQSYLFNVLALDTSEADTPQILEVRKSVYTQIVDLMEDWGAAMFDPVEPMILVIKRDGKGLGTKYSVQISAKKHVLPKGVMAKINNLDDYVKQESEEQQRRALTAINSVAGLLPPPPSADRPKTPADAAADDDLAHARRAAAAAKPVAADVALDDELDDLLGDLGTGTD
jgi:hypothetical protein